MERLNRSKSLQWRHNGRDSVSNHQPHHCLLNRLFRHTSKETSFEKLRITGLCVCVCVGGGGGDSPATGEFPAQMASNAENVSIWWRHHVHWNHSALSISHGIFSPKNSEKMTHISVFIMSSMSEQRVSFLSFVLCSMSCCIYPKLNMTSLVSFSFSC